MIDTFMGGIVMIRLGIHRALWLFGVVQIVSILGFAALAHIGPNQLVLAIVVAFEYLGVGLGTAAFVAFICQHTNLNYSATQFALLTAIAALPRTFANASIVHIVELVDGLGIFLLSMYAIGTSRYAAILGCPMAG